MRRLLAIVTAASLGACGADEQQAVPRSRPAPSMVSVGSCPALPLLQGDAPRRTEPLDPASFPPALRRQVASSADTLAVASLQGGTVCIDIRRMITVGKPMLQQNDRFLTFAWEGYQADGYRSDGMVLVDRAGPGKQIDTGGQPAFSASGEMFAAVHQSPNAFSALEGLGIWKVGPFATVQVTKMGTVPEMLDWRVDGWGGEDCISLSAVPFSRMLGTSVDLASAPRDRFAARRGEAGWSFGRTGANGCPS